MRDSIVKLTTFKANVLVIILAVLIFTLACVSQLGCSFATPGLDTRISHEGRTSTVWTNAEARSEDGTLIYPDGIVIEENTTHNRKITTIEGENAVVEFFPDGTPKMVTGAVAILHEQSAPEDVSSSAQHRDTKNAEAWAATMQTMQTIVGQIIPLLQQQAAARRVVSTQPSIQDRLLEEILRRNP